MTRIAVWPLLGQVDVPGWVTFLVVVAVFVVPFVLGSLIARALKLRDLGFKIGVVLFAAALGLTPFVWQVVLGGIEQNQYEAALADWESRQLPEDEQEKFRQALDELREAKPDLRIEH